MFRPPLDLVRPALFAIDRRNIFQGLINQTAIDRRIIVDARLRRVRSHRRVRVTGRKIL
jgi:hypothetical protein